jgi:hypothetical protein
MTEEGVEALNSLGFQWIWIQERPWNERIQEFSGIKEIDTFLVNLLNENSMPCTTNVQLILFGEVGGAIRSDSFKVFVGKY